MQIRRAVVVGAGVAGLAVAGALSRAGCKVTVLERSERLRADRVGLLVWPNGVHALRALGLGPGLDEIAVPVTETVIRRPDGRVLTRSSMLALGERLGAPVVAVHQPDLHDALVAALGDVEIHTGVHIDAIHTAGNRPPAVGDGSQWWEADLVVAADGISSVVRLALAPEAGVTPAGYTTWRAVVPPHRLPDGITFGESVGAGYRFLITPLGSRGVAWVAVVPGAARPESPEVQLELLRRYFDGWHSPVGELIAATRPEELRQEAVADLDPLPRRFGFTMGGGGVAFVGDAAHAMTPNLGQGACLALEDAVTLGRLMAAPEPSLEVVLSRYDRLRRRRATRLVRRSRRLGMFFGARGRFAVGARNTLLSAAPSGLLSRANAIAAAWLPPE